MDTRLIRHRCLPRPLIAVSILAVMPVSAAGDLSSGTPPRTRQVTGQVAPAPSRVPEHPAPPSPENHPSPWDSIPTGEIDEYLRGVFPAEGPGAAVVVMGNGEVLFQEGYGLARVEARVPVIPSTIFALGSMTKPFTALGILTLAQDGRLGLDDSITRFIPEFPEPLGTVTLRHLLSHTSGVANYTELDAFRGRVQEEFGREELLSLIQESQPDFAPGTAWKYSNSGYALLAMVIERATGQDYGDFLRERVFGPLGMESTRKGLDNAPVSGGAQGYTIQQGEAQKARAMSFSHALGSGDLLSTVEDLGHWHRELAAGHLLSGELMGEYLRPAQLASGESVEYSLGWFFGSLQGSPMLSHGGGVYGFVGHMVWLPREGVFVALLTNRVNPSATPATHVVAERVAALAVGRPVEAQERIAVELEPALLEGLVGTYEIHSLTGGVTWRMILLEEGELYYAYEDGRKLRISPESPTSFFAEGAAATLTFELDASGAATAFVVHTGSGPEIRAERVR